MFAQETKKAHEELTMWVFFVSRAGSALSHRITPLLCC